MKWKVLLILSLLVLGVMVFAGCAAGVNPSIDVPPVDGESAGFWMGLWHGFISPVTFIISIFSDNVNVYEVFNTGNWYDFGFMIGISAIFGGGIAGGSKKRKK